MTGPQSGDSQSWDHSHWKSGGQMASWPWEYLGEVGGSAQEIRIGHQHDRKVFLATFLSPLDRCNGITGGVVF